MHIGISNCLHHPKRRDDGVFKSVFDKYPRPVLPASVASGPFGDFLAT
jgi:hypothetical protein